MNSQIIIFLLLTFSLDLNFGFECPQEGLRFKGDILETIVGLPAGWRYWQHCSKLCLDNPDCVVWSVYDRFNDSIHQHKYCYLFQNYTILPDDNMKYTSGHRNCSEIIPIPSENEYQPGTPGGAWNELEISITRQRILEMLKQEDETVYRNYDDTKEKGESRVTENSMIRLGFHDCLRYENGSGGCDGCVGWDNMGWRPTGQGTNPVPERTDNNDFSRLLFWLEYLYTTIDWPFSHTGSQPAVSLKDSGKSRADLWAFASWVAMERAIERANHACDHDYYARQQVTLLEGRDKCYFKLDKIHKFRYGRRDCIPTDPILPYKAPEQEKHPLFHGTGTESVNFMKEVFNMPADEFIALVAIHSTSKHGPGLHTKYDWFSASYLSNMYHKTLASRPMFNYRPAVGGMINDGLNMGVFGRGNATDQSFTAVGTNDGQPNPHNTTRWKLYCQMEYNSTEGGPCTWRPLEYAGNNRASCFDGFAKNGTKMVDQSRKGCSEAWIDELGIEHNPLKQPSSDEQINKVWAGSFALPMEYGLYKKFQNTAGTTSGPAYRPVGCPALPDKWEDFAHMHNEGAKSQFRWTDIEDCPLNDFAPEGKSLHKIVEEMADDHDIFASKFLDGYERMIENGYDSESELHVAPTNSWFGYYTMEGQPEKFGHALDHFEEFIDANAPVIMTNPNVDPYVVANCILHKCGWTFSKLDEMASWQYEWPLRFQP